MASEHIFRSGVCREVLGVVTPLFDEAAASCCLPPLCGYIALHHHHFSCYFHHLSDYSLPGNKECVIFFKR